VGHIFTRLNIEFYKWKDKLPAATNSLYSETNCEQRNKISGVALRQLLVNEIEPIAAEYCLQLAEVVTLGTRKI
jgi:hypothetical protein